MPEPLWRVIDYVREEVLRQGHDIDDLDGVERTGWMLDGWSYALACSETRPSIQSAIALGKLVERHKNKRGLRTCGVRVGSRLCPKPEDVPRLLTLLWEQRDVLTPMEFYKGFEEVHPFVDGNGRTGKILLNWLNETLLAPIFPPADLWGRAIQNP